MEIKAKTAMGAWRQILDGIMKEGYKFTDRRHKECKEALNIVTKIESTEGILTPLNILRKFNKWHYPSEEKIKESILGNEDPSEYYYNYGQRAFDHDGIDQINEYLIPLLRDNPNSKRGIVVFYNPIKDTLPLKKETPGLVMMNFNIRDGKLHSTMIIRSNDMFHGWPANIAQAYFLTEYVAKKLNYPIGEISTISISAHIFEEQFEDIKKII